MRVLLVQSFLGGAEPLVYPLGIACLSSCLKDHEVRLLDTNLSARPFEDLKALVSEFRPAVVGISLRNIDSTNKRKVVFYYQYLGDTVAAIKEVSDARIVVGGSGFSMFAERVMSDRPEIDFGVLLEGEKTFPLLLKNLDSPEKVGSVFYRRDGSVVYSGPGEQVDLDSAPYPDRDGIPLEAYKAVPEAIGIETKRGCILDCVYCIYGFLNGKKLRPRDPAKVVDEVETLNKKYGVASFTFVDSVFNIPQRHAEEICRELLLRKLDVRWSAWFHERGLTPEFLALLREAGCRNVILSPDGFSDEVLAKLGKNIKNDDILRSYEALRSIDGVEVSYNFFKNPPGQTLAAFVGLLFFSFRAKREMGRRVHFEFNSMRIEPHTKLHQYAVSEGAMAPGEDLLFPKYYSNRGTWYIEWMFNLMLRLKGK